jgi:hypothetical protein
MAGALFAGAGIAGLALCAGCQLVLDFAPLADAAPPDADIVVADAPLPDAMVDPCEQFEPNDRLDDGVAIAPGALQAAICGDEDSDYFLFDLDGKQDMSVDLTFEAGDNDLELQLYENTNGTLLEISTGMDGDERIEHSEEVSGRLPAGNYGVRVFGRVPEAQNGYELTLTVGLFEEPTP